MSIVRPALVALSLALALPLAGEARADSASQTKPKPTKASVTALKGKLAAASAAIRSLAKEPAPKALSADKKKTYAEEMAKLTAIADKTDEVVTDLEAGLKDAKSKIDSLSEMGEMESLRLQMAMDRLSKIMSTLSNLLKKQSDTAQTITQNLK